MKNIIEKAVKGDKKAFEKLYEISKNQVYFTCLGIVKNKSDAEDITQEVYITVLKKLSTLSDSDSFQAWINRIAVTKSLKFIKKNHYDSLEEKLEKESIPDEELVLPDDYVSSKEKRQIVMDIIMNSLSDVQRQTVILYYFDDFSTADISKAMKCPIGTVTYRLSSARKLIKSEVLEYERKNGDRLHILVPFSLGTFLKKQSESVSVPPLNPKIPAGISVSVSKAVIALAVPVIAIGGITALKISDKNETVPSVSEHTEFIAENIENPDIIISNTATSETITTTITTTTITTTTAVSSEIQSITETAEIIEEIYTEVPEVYYTDTEIPTDISEPEFTTETTVTTTENINPYDSILENIDSYQEIFFEYLEKEYNSENIYIEVENAVSQDNEYYQRYVNVIPELEANRYGYENAPDDYYYNPVTVYDQQYRAFEELLNSEYDYIKNHIPDEDFSRLEKSQEKWIQNRDNFINNVLPFNGDYAFPQVGNARAELDKFRCLLLLLYL